MEGIIVLIFFIFYFSKFYKASPSLFWTFIILSSLAVIIKVIYDKKTQQRHEIERLAQEERKRREQKEDIKPMPPPVKRTYKKYICNQKTLVFHSPSCSYLKGIDLDCLYSDEYIAYENDTKYSRLVELGYKPCKRCQPQSFYNQNIKLENKESDYMPEPSPVKDKRKKGKSIIDNISNYTVIDLETTSKCPKYAEIIELSAARVRSGQITEKFTQLVKPSKPVPKDVTDLTGITDEMLADAPRINKVIQNFIDFIGNDTILGHNIVNYDSTILYDICEKLKLKTFSNYMLDTLRYSQYCDIDVPDRKLKTISEYFGIEHKAHRALNDCIANFEVYEKLKENFKGRLILTESGQSCRKFTPISSLTVKPCYSDIKGKNIVITGEFSCGQREDVKSYFEELGALIKSSVSGKTDYLIVGALGNSNWKFGDYGDKVAKAQELQLKGKPIEIIQEDEFFE